MTTLLFRALTGLQRRKHRHKGFTLVELLVVTLIAGGIVSGLMLLVVELLTADQRDASRNATQQDMQRSLDYISTEMRDAVYVYSGDCLYGTGERCNNRPPVLNYLPASLRNNSTPVIAFWKQAPLPSNVLNYCRDRSGNVTPDGNPAPILDAGGVAISCQTGNAYSLVVYSLNTDNPSGSPWSGKARITRYELRPYENNPGQPSLAPGYVGPVSGQQQNLFASWPLDVNGVSRQTALPTGAAVPLTDFVDVPRNTDPAPFCPTNTGESYSMSPPAPPANPPAVFPTSFFACVNTTIGTTNSTAPQTGTASAQAIENQEVILYLRGNGVGRPSITEEGTNSYRPTLTTRVFNRGTLDINPNQN